MKNELTLKLDCYFWNEIQNITKNTIWAYVWISLSEYVGLGTTEIIEKTLHFFRDEQID